MLIFIDGPDGAGKDTIARMLSWVTGIPLIDTISGDILFKNLTPALRKYHVIHEYNILKAVDWSKVDAIKVRNTAISHTIYHPEDQISFKPIRYSLVVIVDDGSDETKRYIEITRKQGWNMITVRYCKQSLSELFDVVENIRHTAEVFKDLEVD